MTPTKLPLTTTYVSELLITSPLGTEVVRSFDKAWHRILALPRPASASFVQFVRND
jgi:hypothetical protein